MFLKAILLKDQPLKNIEVRLIHNEEDIYLGEANWDGSVLTGSSKEYPGILFSTHNKVWKYKFDENGKLTYWINSAFIGCDD